MSTVPAMMQSEILKMARAVAYGEHADEVFAQVCADLHLDLRYALHAPLDTVALLQLKARGRA